MFAGIIIGGALGFIGTTVSGIFLVKLMSGSSEQRIRLCLVFHKHWPQEYHAACDVDAGFETVETAASLIRDLERTKREESSELN